MSRGRRRAKNKAEAATELDAICGPAAPAIKNLRDVAREVEEMADELPSPKKAPLEAKHENRM